MSKRALILVLFALVVLGGAGIYVFLKEVTPTDSPVISSPVLQNLPVKAEPTDRYVFTGGAIVLFKIPETKTLLIRGLDVVNVQDPAKVIEEGRTREFDPLRCVGDTNFVSEKQKSKSISAQEIFSTVNPGDMLTMTCEATAANDCDFAELRCGIKAGVAKVTIEK